MYLTAIGSMTSSQIAGSVRCSTTRPRTCAARYGFSSSAIARAILGSLSRFFALDDVVWVKKAIRSPTLVSQTGTTSGEPSGRVVAR